MKQSENRETRGNKTSTFRVHGQENDDAKMGGISQNLAQKLTDKL